MSKKLNIENFERWNHHNNGWNYIIQKLHEHIGSTTSNVFLEPAIEDTLGYKQSKEALVNYKNNKWIGFSHLDINDRRKQITLPYLSQKYSEVFENCLGIFVFSEKQKEDLITLKTFSNISISKLYHPITTRSFDIKYDIKSLNMKSCNNSSPSNCLMTVGDHCREFKKYCRLKTPYKKYAIIPNGDTWKGRSQTWRRNNALKYNNVSVKQNLSEKTYYKCFENNLQFAEFENPVASNYVLECISFATPLFVSRNENIVEYLGKEYPFYISGPHKRWNKKLCNKDLINDTHNYLLNVLNKEYFSISFFLDNIIKSKVYNQI